MACLWCQKQPEDHTLKEIQFCLEWITEQHGIRSEQIRKRFEVDDKGGKV